ncbi:Crp/Fnr family transcriptional regulator [soil metagenome]
MTAIKDDRLFRNRLLNSLIEAGHSHVLDLLEPVDLPVSRDLELVGEPVSHMYFLETGIASVVAGSLTGQRIEIGLIGYEGVTGLPIIMGDKVSVHSIYMQVAGNGSRIASEWIRKAMDGDDNFRRLFTRFVHTFLIQASHTALANGRASILERLARWILMANDRVEGDTLVITHEFLALMLGVRRAGVTVALHELEGKKLIRATRGQILIHDRKGLEAMTDGFYGRPEAEYRRLAEM